MPHTVSVQVWLSRKRTEDEGPRNKLYTLYTYVSVTDFKNLDESLQLMVK